MRLNEWLPPAYESSWPAACLWTVVALGLLFYRGVLVPRLQDADMSRAWALLMFFPPADHWHLCRAHSSVRPQR